MISATTAGVTAILCMLCLLAPAGPDGPPSAEGGFAVWDIRLDSGDVAVAAWQVELAGEGDDFRIVGIEGGDHAAFREPPHYDPRALQGGRVVLAAFDTGAELPAGDHRVASVHVHSQQGALPPTARLIVAADAEGRRVDARIHLVKGD